MKTISDLTLRDYAEAHGHIIDDAVQYGIEMAKTKFRADHARRLSPGAIAHILMRADAVYSEWQVDRQRDAA